MGASLILLNEYKPVVPKHVEVIYNWKVLNYSFVEMSNCPCLFLIRYPTLKRKMFQNISCCLM